MMSSVRLGIFHVEGGMRVYPSGSFASQKKKATKMGHDSRKGTRNLAVFQPQDAPRVRPRMRRMIATSTEKQPRMSSRLKRSFSLRHSSFRSPLVLGVKGAAANAKGTMMMTERGRQRPVLVWGVEYRPLNTYRSLGRTSATPPFDH